MPVELRKRKPAEAVLAAAPVRKKSKAAKVVETVKEAVTGKVTPKPKAKSAAPKQKAAISAKAEPATNGSAQRPAVGEVIDLNGFGGEITRHDGESTTLKALVEESTAGVVLFTYPRASTSGCELYPFDQALFGQSPIPKVDWRIPGTTQACLFRDSYTPLTSTGLRIYGLSDDSPKANTTFKTKQNLPYPLLCDPERTLIAGIGFLKDGGKGTKRGVFIVNKDGKVLAAEPGGPNETVDVVHKIVGTGLESKKTTKVGGADGDIDDVDAKLWWIFFFFFWIRWDLGAACSSVS
jgi:thioredoxin-dependent peroxiredoxin